ncbi:hypothetical protein [Hymenobacter weizhouensis]|uniref:hypothetical protein n=1 Tax=Hymenobacter sp. YIM 151500-1 TaxID=2987689 RepID=UPI00222647BF|nr:hypothetical protein [Hymenobacter sp. YIM 151500-1]UYZ63729.1 hypothetical protein OIS53_02540 [Hymenobacter sp. YIM 151500-1]
MSRLILLTLGTLLVSPVCRAQTEPKPAGHHRPALFRLGVGNSLNGSGDYPVLKVSAEYAPQFGQHLRLGSRLAYIGSSEPYEFGYGYTIPQSYRALNLEQEVYWLPFRTGKTVEFSVGGGGFVGYAHQKSFQWASLDANRVFTYKAYRERGFHVGYIASLNLDFALTPDRTWRLGGRLALQNDTRANILPGGQFQLSRAW